MLASGLNTVDRHAGGGKGQLNSRRKPDSRSKATRDQTGKRFSWLALTQGMTTTRETEFLGFSSGLAIRIRFVSWTGLLRNLHLGAEGAETASGQAAPLDTCRFYFWASAVSHVYINHPPPIACDPLVAVMPLFPPLPAAPGLALLALIPAPF
jgi:hypothetical protein